MKKNFYYFKEDAEIAAKEFAAENNTDVLRKASVDVSTNFDFSDEPAKSLCPSGEISAIKVSSKKDSLEDLALFAYWSSIEEELYFIHETAKREGGVVCEVNLEGRKMPVICSEDWKVLRNIERDTNMKLFLLVKEEGAYRIADETEDPMDLLEGKKFTSAKSEGRKFMIAAASSFLIFKTKATEKILNGRRREELLPQSEQPCRRYKMRR